MEKKLFIDGVRKAELKLDDGVLEFFNFRLPDDWELGYLHEYCAFDVHLVSSNFSGLFGCAYRIMDFVAFIADLKTVMAGEAFYTSANLMHWKREQISISRASWNTESIAIYIEFCLNQNMDFLRYHLRGKTESLPRFIEQLERFIDDSM